MIPAYSLAVGFGIVGVGCIAQMSLESWWYLVVTILVAGLYLAALDFVETQVPSDPYTRTCTRFLAIIMAIGWWITLPLMVVIVPLSWWLVGRAMRNEY